MPHSLGTNSKKQYDTLHSDLQMVVDWVLAECLVDFTLVEGYRTPAKQFMYYKKGRKFIDGEWVLVQPKNKITNVDGMKIKGKHNYNPSLAVDFCAYVPEKPQLKWDAIHLTYIASCFLTVAEFLHKEGLIEHKLRWGGNWDKDGDLSDNTLYDRPHVELYIP